MQVESNNVEKPKRKKRRKGILGYFLLFAVVFSVALSGLYYFVNSYSPSVDVSIGNEEELTLTQPDVAVEMKTIDERLKWIQMEDEMPSVAIRESLEDEEKVDKNKKESDKILEKTILEQKAAVNEVEPPKPTMSDIVKNTTDFRTVAKQAVIPVQNQTVIPSPIPTLTKVYLGEFTSVDEAMAVQQQISSEMPDTMPFIKSINGTYIVQLGSFSNKEIADAFILKVQEKGYSPKILSQN